MEFFPKSTAPSRNRQLCGGRQNSTLSSPRIPCDRCLIDAAAYRHGGVYWVARSSRPTTKDSPAPVPRAPLVGVGLRHLGHGGGAPLLESDRRAFSHHGGEIQRVPIGQAHASVRLALAHFRRFRRTVN